MFFTGATSYNSQVFSARVLIFGEVGYMGDNMTTGHKTKKLFSILAKTPPWAWPWRVFAIMTRPIPPGLYLVNFFVQRILRVNAACKWQVHFTSRVLGDVQIGEKVADSFALSGGCYIQAGNGIKIGSGTLFAPGVKMVSANHHETDMERWVEDAPIEIGENCWIGANACILPGVKLGDGCVVGAGSVVTKSFSDGAVIVGIPARELRKSNIGSKEGDNI